MTFSGSLRSLMPDEVTIEPYLGETGGRVVSLGAAVTHQAQVLPWTERVIDRNGKELKSSLQVILPEQLAIDVRSRLTIVKPTGFSPSQPPIIAVRPYRNLGLDMTAVFC